VVVVWGLDGWCRWQQKTDGGGAPTQTMAGAIFAGKLEDAFPRGSGLATRELFGGKVRSLRLAFWICEHNEQ